MADDLAVFLGHPGTKCVGGGDEAAEVVREEQGIAVAVVDLAGHLGAGVEIGLQPFTNRHRETIAQPRPACDPGRTSGRCCGGGRLASGHMRLESWVGALHERNFRLYFLGQLTSAVGTGMTPVALSFAVLALPHGSASDVGAVLAAETVPLVVFLLVGGVASDRLGRRRVMLSADVLRASAQTGLGTWILVGHPPLWGFLVLSALVGLGHRLFHARP